MHPTKTKVVKIESGRGCFNTVFNYLGLNTLFIELVVIECVWDGTRLRVTELMESNKKFVGGGLEGDASNPMRGRSEWGEDGCEFWGFSPRASGH